jgi:hypothetical protein
MMQKCKYQLPKLNLLLILEQVSEKTISCISELMVDKIKYEHSIINLCMFPSCDKIPK